MIKVNICITNNILSKKVIFMNKEKKRIASIINELIYFLLKNNATNINIEIKDKEKFTIVELTIKDKFYIDKKEIRELKEKLDIPRVEEIEEYYWQLAGNIEGKESLFLIGNMINDSNVYYNKSQEFKIVICRMKDIKSK
ncbi:hypothetical protein [Thermohalobacter berrensis]|nr:hypothetical protein [Thermohalobacter berrensis]